MFLYIECVLLLLLLLLSLLLLLLLVVLLTSTHAQVLPRIRLEEEKLLWPHQQ